MTLRHLRIFAAVCRCGSVTKAAAMLHIAQPSVSLAIRELEEYYQITLFDRISRKLYITEQGERLLKYATHITSLFNEMEESIQSVSEYEPLHIGSSITIANSFLCDFLAQYQQNYPKRNCQVLIETSAMLESKILNNELDLAMVEGIPTHPSIEKLPFFQDELVILCANEHPFTKHEHLSFADLLQEPFMLRERSSGTRAVIDSILQLYNMNVTPIWESASTRALVKGVQRGFGISILPYQMVKEDLQNQSIQRLYVEDINLQREYFIIYHHNKYVTPAMQDFINIALQVTTLQ